MEAESEVSTSHEPGNQSYVSLIRQEQEAKREQHARAQQKRRNCNLMAGEGRDPVPWLPKGGGA